MSLGTEAVGVVSTWLCTCGPIHTGGLRGSQMWLPPATARTSGDQAPTSVTGGALLAMAAHGPCEEGALTTDSGGLTARGQVDNASWASEHLRLGCTGGVLSGGRARSPACGGQGCENKSAEAHTCLGGRRGESERQ